MNAFGFLSLTGSVAYESRVVDVDFNDNDTLDPGDMAGARLSLVSISGASGSISAGGVGFSVTGGSLSIASLSAADPLADTREFVAVIGSLGTATLTGIDDLTLNLSALSLELNRGQNSAGPITALNWQEQVRVDTAFGDDVVVVDALGAPTTIGFTSDRFFVSATIDLLEAFDFVTASGTITFESGLVDVLRPYTDATLTQLAVTVTTATIGAGRRDVRRHGREPPGRDGHAGVRERRSSLARHLLEFHDRVARRHRRPDARAVWRGDRAQRGQRNRRDAAGLDPARRPGDRVVDHRGRQAGQRVSGRSPSSNLFDFVTASNGSIAYESTTADVVGLGLTPGTDLVDATLSRIAITVGSLSVGAGGIGITVTGGQLYVAWITPAAVADTRSWRTIESSLTTGWLTGIEGLVLELAAGFRSSSTRRSTARMRRLWFR